MPIRKLLQMLLMSVSAMLMLPNAPPLAAQIGPVLQIEVEASDTTRCGTRECWEFVFRNVGTAPLLVESVDAFQPPFDGPDFSSILPLALDSGSEARYRWCYTAGADTARFSQSIDVVSNGRQSLSIALVFDASLSMDWAMGGGDPTARLVAAKRAVVEFINTMVDVTFASTVDTVVIRDEAALITFNRNSAVRQPFTTNQNLLRNAVQSVTTGSGTCIYTAVIRAIDEIEPRPIRQKVIILLTDGDDNGFTNCANGMADLQARLARFSVPVYTVGMGSSITPAGLSALRSIASLSGGAYFNALTENDLLAVYDSIARMLSREPSRRSFEVGGRTVAPYVQIAPTSIDFDTVWVGGSRCTTVTVTNTGNAPMSLASVALAAGDYSTLATDTSEIPPGESREISICFTPSRLRVIQSSGTVTTQLCAPLATPLALRGVGLDSVTIALLDTFSARPGSTIMVPVYLQNALPAEYDVDEYSLSVAYNKTVMFPDVPFVATAGSHSRSMSSATHLTTYSGDTARTDISVSGGTLSASHSGGVLVYLRFRMLLGNSIATDLSLPAALYADGNPRVGRVGASACAIDSICYIEGRLIDASRRFARLTDVRYADDGLEVSYELDRDAEVSVALYDNAGRRYTSLAHGTAAAGSHRLAASIQSLPAGRYYVVLQSGGATQTRSIVVVR